MGKWSEQPFMNWSVPSLRRTRRNGIGRPWSSVPFVGLKTPAWGEAAGSAAGAYAACLGLLRAALGALGGAS